MKSGLPSVLAWRTAAQLFRELVPGKGQRQVVVEVVPAQERQGDLAADAPPLEFQLDRPKGVLAPQQVRRAVGKHQQQAQARALAAEVGQQIDARRVGPVDVVQEHHQGALPRHFVQEHAEFALPAFLRGLLGLREHAGQGRVVRGQRRQLHVPSGSQQLHRLRRRRTAFALEQTVQRLQERQIGLGAGQALGTTPTGEAPGLAARPPTLRGSSRPGCSCRGPARR